MARAKKTELYVDLYKDLSLEDKKILRTELDYSIKADERSMEKSSQIEDAKKMRDKLKIHDKVKFLFKKEELTGEVVAITVDKVQVLDAAGLKRSVPYHKIVK